VGLPNPSLYAKLEGSVETALVPSHTHDERNAVHFIVSLTNAQRAECVVDTPNSPLEDSQARLLEGGFPYGFARNFEGACIVR
jgi:hypothetical protein